MADKPMIFNDCSQGIPMIFHDKIEGGYTDIVNPDFETGSLYPWVKMGFISSSGLTTLYPYVYEGNYSLMIQDYGNTGYENRFSDVRGINVWLGQTITTSCWCRCDVPNKVGLEYYCQSSPIETDIIFHSGSNQWEYLSATFTVPMNSTYVAVRSITIGDYAIGYFDNFSVTPSVSMNIPMIFYSRNV